MKTIDCNVIMLPTTHEFTTFLCTIGKGSPILCTPNKAIDNSVKGIADIQPQHLYFLLGSKKTIKQGDLYYLNNSLLSGEADIMQCQDQEEADCLNDTSRLIGRNTQKVACATKSSLGLPSIPETFIGKYAASGGTITKVKIQEGYAYYKGEKLDAVFENTQKGIADIFIPNKVTVNASDIEWEPRVNDNNEVFIADGEFDEQYYSVPDRSLYADIPKEHILTQEEGQKWQKEQAEKQALEVAVETYLSKYKNPELEHILCFLQDAFTKGAEWKEKQIQNK